MIIGIIKSIIFMFIFYVFLRISNFIIKFIYNILYKKNNNKNENSKELKMLQCDICKIYITKSESHFINGKTLCNEHKDSNQ